MNKVQPYPLSCEWLQTNRLGSFAMGSVDRIPRRKYHSLLTVREPGIGDPLNIILGVGEFIDIGPKLYLLSSMDFGDRTEPRGFQHLSDFSFRPTPRWSYDLDGVNINRVFELDPTRDIARLHYSVTGVRTPIKIRIRPLILCRPMHHLTRQNAILNGAPVAQDGKVSFRFYDSLPPVNMKMSDQSFVFEPSGHWVNGIHYRFEIERGYPGVEDAFVPGEFTAEIKSDASFYFECGVEPLVDHETPSRQKQARDSSSMYLMESKSGFHSIIAGFPWFGSWGRDTLVSLSGLCLETGGIDKAEEILASYSETVVDCISKKGFVAAFQDKGLITTGIDTPLLLILAIQRLIEKSPSSIDLMPTACQCLNAIRHSLDSRIKVTDDGGLFIEQGPWASTWMDVMMDGQPVTPRNGFAVEINAMFFNALSFAMNWAKLNDRTFAKAWQPVFEKAERSFCARFWSDAYGFLADTHDGNTSDFSLRPNQLWAIGLPYSPVTRKMGASALAAVDRELLTPVGLRTLSYKDPRYRGKYGGSHRERDLAYHQGTVWPWLIGIYADAVNQIHGKDKVREKVGPILEHLALHMEQEGCLGHISEVFDGDFPHTPGGAPAQAWSMAEMIRAKRKAEK